MADRQKFEVIDVQQFDGLNTLDDPSVLSPSESPYMVNMDITSNGSVQTRYGYEKVLDITGTGGMKGALPYYKTYGTNNGDYLLLFYGGNVYYWQNGDTSATLIGSYGTESNQVRGVVHNNVACFGDGDSANNPKYWDASTLSNLSTTLKTNIYGIYNNRIFASGNASNQSTVNYSDSSTTNTNLDTNFVAVAIGDGTKVTALLDNNDSLYVFKENSIHSINYSFDSTYNETLPKVQPIIMSNGGCVAPGSAQNVYGYMYFLSRSGFQNFGNLEQGVTASLPLPLSFKIEPTVNMINLAEADNITSEFFQGKYICAVPMNNSTLPSGCLVWNEIVKRRFGKDNWVYYNNIPAAQFAIFRDENKRDQLYFVSAAEPALYKFNNTFSDNGFGYNRIWRSKTFRFGERTRWHYIDIEGSKTLNSTVYVDMWLDGVNYTGVTITDSNLISGAGGGYIGENNVGDNYTGGGFTATSNSPLYKFKKRVRVPYPTNEGYQFYFQVRNNADGEGWKLSRFRMKYEYMPDDPSYPYTD